MWLLHAVTYKLQYFVGEGDKPPRYAILSHCWDPDPDNEVVFAELRNLEIARAKPGWRKVMHACHAAHECGFDWLWIDTCCIDKSSSAELSQAINSMFAWYAAASVCLAYLNDVDADEDPQAPESSFRASRWFKRGWTLQELVAPRTLLFFSRDWRKIGCKTGLADTVSEITTIEPRVLCCSWVHFGRISVARRMSWAAGRQTSRPEDRAYSLMGIFYVNMPTVYGEGGRKAFHRLQIEIIRQSPDHSIFAWGVPLHRPLSSVGPHGTQMRRSSLLASSPDVFRNSATFTPIPMERLTGMLGLPPVDDPHYYETNYGIRIQLPLRRVSPEGSLYCALLAVVRNLKTDAEDPIGLLLQRRGETSTYHCLASSSFQPTLHISATQHNLVHIPPPFVPLPPSDSESTYSDGEQYAPKSPPEWKVTPIYIVI